MLRKAACCCGDCTVEVQGEPTLNAVCNCSSCKKRTGSAFGWSVYFRNEDIVARHGELKAYDLTGEVPGRRWFCPRCGSTLMWDGGAFMPGQTGFAGGCFADTPLGEPNLSAYDERRCAWVGLPANWMGVVVP